MQTDAVNTMNFVMDICMTAFIIIVIAAVLFWFFYGLKDVGNTQIRSSISDIALRDLSYIGEYSEKVRTSVKYWVYGIFVSSYKINPEVDIYETIIKWNDEKNHDPQSYIRDGIEDARTLFLSDFDTARELDVPVTFKCSSDFNYHEFPGSFNYNEYINPTSLVEAIDKILEV